MNTLARGAFVAAVVVVSACTLVACESLPGSRAEPPAATAAFDEALHGCRMKQPGRINRRLSLPPNSPSVTACLHRLGWESTGSPL